LAKTALFLLLSTVATAQENASPGLLRGVLQTWSATGGAGAFVFLGSEDHRYSCTYDQKTYVERDSQPSTFGHLQKGDRLEIVSDRVPNSSVCYARTVHVMPDAPRARLVPGVRPHPKEPALAALPPRANLTFTGVVVRVTPTTLTLRSRTGEHQLLHLRADTRFLREGQVADSGSLRANTRVFVRAGKNLDDEVEAYQVVWGEILNPEQ